MANRSVGDSSRAKPRARHHTFRNARGFRFAKWITREAANSAINLVCRVLITVKGRFSLDVILFLA
jgi:hypothetical protein